MPPARRSYIRQKHPFWNATGGSDHFYFTINDRGACNLNSSHAELWAPIKLVHFGAFSSNITRDLNYTRNYEGRGHRGYGCFDPTRDIVVAPSHESVASQAAFTYYSPHGRQQFEQKRSVLLAFAGAGELLLQGRLHEGNAACLRAGNGMRAGM